MFTKVTLTFEICPYINIVPLTFCNVWGGTNWLKATEKEISTSDHNKTGGDLPLYLTVMQYRMLLKQKSRSLVYCLLDTIYTTHCVVCSIHYTEKYTVLFIIFINISNS